MNSGIKCRCRHHEPVSFFTRRSLLLIRRISALGFAALIPDGAAGLACGLAGGLALAAAALLDSVLKILRIQCFDMLHDHPSVSYAHIQPQIITQWCCGPKYPFSKTRIADEDVLA